MRMLLVVLSLAISGCAASVVSSSPRTVVVDAGKPPKGRAGEAQRLADAECAKHKRLARMIGRPEYGASTEYIFDCVE